MPLVSYPTVFVMPSRPPPLVVLSYANLSAPARVAPSAVTLCLHPAGPQFHPAAGCVKTCTGCSLVCALRPSDSSLPNFSWTVLAATAMMKAMMMALSSPSPPATTCGLGPPCPGSISASTTAIENLIGKLFSSPAVTAGFLPVPAFQPGIVFQPLCGLCAAFEQQLSPALAVPLSLVLVVLLPGDQLLAPPHPHLLSDQPGHVIPCHLGLLLAGPLAHLKRLVVPLTCSPHELLQAAALLPAVLTALPGTHSGSRTSTAQVASLSTCSPLTRCPGSSTPATWSRLVTFPASSTTLTARKPDQPLNQVPAVPLLGQPHRVAQVQSHLGHPEDLLLPASPAAQPYLHQVVPAVLRSPLQHPPQVPVLELQPRCPLYLRVPLRRSVRPAHQVGSASALSSQYTPSCSVSSCSSHSQPTNCCTTPNTNSPSNNSCLVTFR